MPGIKEVFRNLPRIQISLTVLVPFILGGSAVLGLVGADSAFRVLSFTPRPDDRLLWQCVAVGGVVYIASTVLFLLVLGPVRRFLASAGHSPLVTAETRAPSLVRPVHDLEHFDQVFGQVAEVLSKLDAKSLFPEIIGQSRAMRSVFRTILKVAPTDSTVLLTGESGTGKELIAKTIHGHSARAKGPFVAVNCAAIPDGLLESELFGYEKGAFTGAQARKKGYFELAAGGTIFLDEIGDMSPDTQAKMLRVLENRECVRVGGASTIRLDVRVIAATNRDLKTLLREGRFREDLYHRLNVFPLFLPPLRERREDIPLLANWFLETSGREARPTSEAMQLLMAHDWTGNVRELRNVMERAAVLAEGDRLTPEHLPGLTGSPASRSRIEVGNLSVEGASLDERLAAIERALIVAALERTAGVQSRAARLLGIKERSLWHRVRKYAIAPGAYKEYLP